MTAKSFFLFADFFHTFSSIFKVKHLKFEIIAKEVQKREVLFLNDVLVAVAVLLS